MVCRQCGKELPKNFTINICFECSKENVRKIFKENPEIKDAFRESIEEMKKPENMKKMVDDTVRFMGAVQSMQKR